MASFLALYRHGKSFPPIFGTCSFKRGVLRIKQRVIIVRKLIKRAGGTKIGFRVPEKETEETEAEVLAAVLALRFPICQFADWTKEIKINVLKEDKSDGRES